MLGSAPSRRRPSGLSADGRSASLPERWSDRAADRLADLRLRLRRVVLGHRRLLAFVLVAGAVLTGVRATAAPETQTIAVMVVAHDLPGGIRLEPADLRVADLPPADAPAGRIRDPVGQVLAGPVRRGEAVTDARVVGPGLTAGRRDLVTVPVRFPDVAMVSLLEVGDHIDVLAADPQGGVASVVVRDCPVLALPSLASASDAAIGVSGEVGGGRLVVLGVPDAAVTSVSGASVSHFLTFAFAR